MTDEEREIYVLVRKLDLQLNGTYHPFDMYGQDAYIPGSKAEVIELCLQFAKAYHCIITDGERLPISYEMAKRKARTRKRKEGGYA